MTEITVFRNRDGGILGFESLGHAGYAEQGEDIVCAALSVLVINTLNSPDKGEDIVCAGISALVINTVNSLGRFTEEQFTVDASEEEGRIALRLKEPAGHDGGLLIKSLILGLEEIQHTYGNDYLVLDFREV